MGLFADTISRFAPPWFLEPEMMKLLRAVGGAWDDMAQRAYDGLRNAIPYSAQLAAPVVTEAANNGSGLVRLTLDTTAPLLAAQAYGGARELHIHSATTTGGLVLNGTWQYQIVSATRVDLLDSTFTGAYTSGAVLSYQGLRQCDPDVLAWHARDRGIKLYSTEPELSKRVRLSRWRQLKKRRGSHRGELENLQPFWLSTPSAVLPTMRIVFQSAESLNRKATWCTLGPTGTFSVYQRLTNWNYDGQTSKRTRFWLIIYLPPGYSSSVVYDDGSTVYDGGAIWDGVTALAIGDIVEAVKEAKAAHSRLAGVIVTELQPTDAIPGVAGTHYPFDPTDTAQTSADGWTSLPTGNWGSIVDPVTNLPTRPPWASWLYEDNP